MKIKNNMEIRNATRAAGLKLWQVAEAFGMTESSFSRLLRKELSPDNKQQVMVIIHRLQERLEPKGVQAFDREDHKPMTASLDTGYTKVPHLLLEALAISNLNRMQLGICLFILRRTYGWNRDDEAIALAEFAAACGCSVSYVSRQVLALVRMKVVRRVAYQSGRIPFYSINLVISDWNRDCLCLNALEINSEKGIYSRSCSEVWGLFTGSSGELNLEAGGVTHLEATAGLLTGVGVNHDPSLEPPWFEPGLKKELKKKKERESYGPDSIPFELSNLLLMKILEHLPGYKRPDLQIWSEQMDIMMRNDHREPEEVKALILYAQNDHFWRGNILSVEKLRKQYDQLNAKRLRALGSSSAGKYRSADSFAEEADEYKGFYR